MGLIFSKHEVTLNYRETKPKVWQARQLTFPKITEKMLIEEISESQGVPKTQTKAVIEALLNRCVHYMEIGHLVSLGSFGSFKPVFNAKVVQNSGEIDKDFNKLLKVKKIQFYPGGDFKKMLKEMSVESSKQAFLHEDDEDPEDDDPTNG